jgi:FkbM family methyltransferase
MSFISYAQNLEDVMLYRALKHLPTGFYIDVGANHPIIDSVTKAFYDRGWHGINIEPMAEYFLLLQQERPRDINLNTLVGSSMGEREFHEFPETGLSTLRKEYAHRSAAEGYAVRTHTVRCTTLDTICLQQGVSTVHFLKIDVEGAEKEVLQGFSFDEVRPWIVVIEANEPFSKRDASEEWATLILSKGYESIYYDGLNRYYIAAEQHSLRAHFQTPPNLFDEYITYPHFKASLSLVQLSPLLPLLPVLRKSKAAVKFLRRVSIQITKSTMRSILGLPPLRKIGRYILANHPVFAAKLLAFVGAPRHGNLTHVTAGRLPITFESLPHSARVIYRDLKGLYGPLSVGQYTLKKQEQP